MGAFAILVKIYWPSDKEEVHLVDSEKFVIGRAPESALVLADPKISRKHLGVLVNKGKIYLKDFGASNGTFIEDKRLSSEDVHPYKTGTSVRLGQSDVMIKFELMTKKIHKELVPGDFPLQDRDSVENMLTAAKLNYENLEKSAEQLCAKLVEQKKIEAQALFEQNTANMEDFQKLKQIEASSLIEIAKNQAQALLEQNTRELEDLRKVKQAEADSFLDIAKNEAQRIKAEIEKFRHDEMALAIQAKTKADQDLADSLEAIKKTLEQKNLEAQTLFEQKNIELEELRKAKQAEAHSLIDIAKIEAQKIQTENQKIRAETQGLMDQAHIQINELKSKADQEILESLEAVKIIVEQKKLAAQAMAEQNNRDLEEARKLKQTEANSLIEIATKEAQKIRAEAQKIKTEMEGKADKIIAESIDAARVIAKEKANQIISEAQREAEIFKAQMLEEKKVVLESQKNELASQRRALEQDFHIEKERWAVERQVHDRILEDDYLVKKQSYNQEIALLETQAIKLREDLAEQQKQGVQKFHELLQKRKEIEPEVMNLQSQISVLEANNSNKQAEALNIEKQFQHAKQEKERAEKQIDEIQTRMTENGKLLLEKQWDLTLLQQDIRMAQNDKIEKLKKISQELSLAKEEINHQVARYRTEMMSQIDGLRVKEQENIHQETQQQLQQLTKQREQFSKRLATEMEGLWLATNGGVQEAMKTNLQERIRVAVKNAFDESYLSSFKSPDHNVRVEVKEISKNRKKFLRQTMMTAGSVLGLFLAISYWFDWAPLKALQASLNPNESAIEALSRAEMEKQAARKFIPAQDGTWKNSYTENILYTQGFLEAEKSPELEDQWIRQLRQVFVKELKQDDELVAQLIGIERSMLSRLEEERKLIHPDFVSIGVKKMHQIEEESVAKMKVVLKTESNFGRFNSEVQKYWGTNLQQYRLPAEQPSN